MTPIKNKISVWLLSCCVLLSCQQKTANVQEDIMKHYSEINKKLKDYKIKHVDDIRWAAGDAITGYYRDEEVKKIVSERFTDTCRTFTEYYFDDGMLIFVLKQNFVYNKPVSYTMEKANALGDSVWYDDKKTVLQVSRFFFNKNKMVKWISFDNKEVSDKTWTFTNKESSLWAEALVLLKELKEQ